VDFFINLVNGIGSFWWGVVFFWVAYFFWGRFLDYPADLEIHIRNGKVWPYLPMFWKVPKKRFIRILNYLLFWIGNLLSACALYFLFPHENLILFIIGMALSIFIEIKIRSFAIKDIVRLQRDRYLQIYTQLASQALARGDEISDSELSSKTQWQHQNDLRLADRQGRLMEFLKGEAKL